MGAQAADECGAAPLRKHRAFVESKTCRRDHRRPIDSGGCELGPSGMARDRCAVVIVAIGNDGPAIVAAWLNQIEFVATPRSHLVQPQSAIGREGEAVGIAMAGGPSLSGATP